MNLWLTPCHLVILRPCSHPDVADAGRGEGGSQLSKQVLKLHRSLQQQSKYESSPAMTTPEVPSLGSLENDAFHSFQELFKQEVLDMRQTTDKTDLT